MVPTKSLLTITFIRMVHRACLELPLSQDPSSRMSRTAAPRFPHGFPPQNAFDVWGPIMKCCFLACFLLFSRAFLFKPKGHLLFLNSASGDGTYNAAPLQLYQDTLPPNWNPVMAMNLTNDLTLRPRDDILDSAGASASAGPKQVLSMAPSSNSAEANCTLAIPLSTAIHDIATGRETNENLSTDLEGFSTDDPEPESVPSTSYPNTSFPPTELGVENDNADYEVVDDLEDPFFSLEEYDGDAEMFALKIWVNRKEHLRAKLGKVEYCQASSGIKCLSEN